MKKFCYRWKGFNSEYQTTQGEIWAYSINFAKAHLIQQGMTNIKVRRKIFPHLNKRITQAQIFIFFRQLSTLIQSGIPILQACETLQKSQHNLLFQKIIESVKNDIASGQGFTNGLKKFPAYFNKMTCHLLMLGEQTGSLDVMLNRVATYQERSFQLKRKIQQALFYPAIVSLIAISITLLMLIYVIPQFEALFESAHLKLPAFTASILFISKVLREKYWLAFLLVFPFFYIKKRHQHFKKKFDLFLLKVPGVHLILQKIILARLARSLATLISAGIPITDALLLSAESCNHFMYEKMILHVYQNVLTGKQLHVAMQNPNYFPPLMLQMIKIGENTGNLDTMLIKITELYEADINHFVTNLSQLLEPLIMIILGALIGSLVIAMYLPIFKLGMVV